MGLSWKSGAVEVGLLELGGEVSEIATSSTGNRLVINNSSPRL